MFVVLRFFKVLTSHWKESSRTISHCNLCSSLLKTWLRCGKTTLNVTYWCLSQGIKHVSFTTTTMDKSNLINLILAQIGGNLNFSPWKIPRISSWAKMKTQAGFTLVGSVLKPNRYGPGEAKEDVWDILEAALLSPSFTWGSGLCPTFLRHSRTTIKNWTMLWSI